jgi:4-carboxymuconolactone decarboxylase
VADDDFAKGLAVQRQLWGDLVAEDGRPQTPSAQLAPDFFPQVTETVFGRIWARPGLELRDRELITIAVLTTLGRLGELRGHLIAAQNIGLSRTELVETLIHVSAYAGLPASVAALDAAAEVLPTEE